MKKRYRSLAGILAMFGTGCMVAPGSSNGNPGPDTYQPIHNSLFQGEKAPPVNAQAPARGLDIVDPSGGRLTLVEMHRQKIREIDELRSMLRSQEQQIAGLQSAANEFEAKLTSFREQWQQERALREQLEKEKQELSARLLDASYKQVEAEKQLLQMKIATLKEKRLSMNPPKNSDSTSHGEKPENKSEPKVETKEHKKEGGH